MSSNQEFFLRKLVLIFSRFFCFIICFRGSYIRFKEDWTLILQLTELISYSFALSGNENQVFRFKGLFFLITLTIRCFFELTNVALALNIFSQRNSQYFCGVKKISCCISLFSGCALAEQHFPLRFTHTPFCI